MIPLTIGTPEQFRTLREFLQDANFTAPAICDRVGINSILDFKGTFQRRSVALEIEDTLDALIHLLMDGEMLAESTLRTLFPQCAVETMQSLRLLEAVEDEPDTPYYATAFLYPVAGLWVASDRITPPNLKKPTPHPRDVVYAAITANTGRFLASLPPIPCEDFLDLCSGTGIAALVAAKRYAKHAWACDITGRSVHFSDFNRCLNGLENVTAAQGDLYEAVGDRTFDRIAAHPPYIPAKKQEWVFRDGGVDGEQILRRVVEGLPQYLRPEGRFYCVTLATDREGETFEQRIRRWLGAAESEFDIVLAAHEVRSIAEEARVAELKQKMKRGQAEEMESLLADLKVTGTFYGAVGIRRKTEQRRAVTARAIKSVQAGSEATEWLLNFETAAARPDFERYLMGARPRFTPGMRLVVTHAPVDGVLVPSEFALTAEYPFVVNGACGQWVAIAVNWLDGNRTAGEVFQQLHEQQVVAPEFSPAEYIDVLRLLISNGVLELERFPLPAMAGKERKQALQA